MESDGEAVFVMRPPNDPNTCFTIPIVQELAATINDSTLPVKYIRSDEDSPLISVLNNGSQLPVIDMSVLLSPSAAKHQRTNEMEKLSRACEQWGFFQVINHGVPVQIMKEAIKACKDFFDLPLEDRMKSRQKRDTEGYGQSFIMSETQILDWADFLYLTILPTSFQQTDVWPSLPQFRDILECYARELEKLSKKLMEMFEENLDLKHGSLVDCFKVWMESIRITYYPPCPRPDLALGLSPHSDGGCLTILLQDGETPGLQIKKDNEWVLVEPLQDAFIVNIGDYMEIMTNGRYKSIEHRAVTNKEKARISMAAFYYPGPEENVQPASELVDPKNPTIYRKISTKDYFQTYLSRKLEGKNTLSDYLASTH